VPRTTGAQQFRLPACSGIPDGQPAVSFAMAAIRRCNSKVRLIRRQAQEHAAVPWASVAHHPDGAPARGQSLCHRARAKRQGLEYGPAMCRVLALDPLKRAV